MASTSPVPVLATGSRASERLRGVAEGQEDRDEAVRTRGHRESSPTHIHSPFSATRGLRLRCRVRCPRRRSAVPEGARSHRAAARAPRCPGGRRARRMRSHDARRHRRPRPRGRDRRSSARPMAGEGRAYELSEPYHLHIAANFWMGSFERGLELAREGSEIGRRRPPWDPRRNRGPLPRGGRHDHPLDRWLARAEAGERIPRGAGGR